MRVWRKTARSSRGPLKKKKPMFRPHLTGQPNFSQQFELKSFQAPDLVCLETISRSFKFVSSKDSDLDVFKHPFSVEVRLRAMSIADSEAAFEQHCKKVDEANRAHPLLVANGIKTMNALAFSCGTPQVPPTDDQFKDFCTSLNSGINMDFGTQACLRRLHFESSAIVMADLKSKATETSGDGPRKLPVAEKIARLQEQERRLPGLRIKGELQPSHALIDMVANIKETNCVIWIPPSKCSKRDAEIQQSMKDKPVTLSLEQQLVKVSSNDQAIHVDTSTDLQLQWALQRRGLAFDQCSLIKHAEHEIWVQQLLGQITREAPTGFSKVSASQIIRADRELFTIMAQEVQSVQVDAAGEFPMEQSLKTLRNDPRVTMHLLPLPKSAAKETGKEAEKAASSTGAPKPPAISNPRPVKKIKSTSAKAKAMCPAELKNFSQRDSSGNAICWSFNQKSGCSMEVTNGRCKKGMHCCIKCHKSNHSLVTCRSAGN